MIKFSVCLDFRNFLSSNILEICKRNNNNHTKIIEEKNDMVEQQTINKRWRHKYSIKKQS